MKKNFIWNLIGSTFNSFTSLFFLIIVTRINGVDDAGIFTFAFANACFMQVIGIYVTRAFQVTEKDKSISDSDYIYSKIITCIFMLLATLVFCVAKGYDGIKFSIIILLVLYKALDAFSESIYAVIQKNDKLYKVGISLFVKGIIGTLVFLISNIITKDMLISTIILILTNILIMLLYDFREVRKCKKIITSFKINKCLKILKLGFWTFVFTLLTQYLINAPKYSIDNYLNHDMQTIYGIVSMPATIMILISNFVIHPFLLKIDSCVSKKEFKKLNKIVLRMLISIVIIGLSAELLAYLVGIPVLNILYGIKLDNYLNELLIIIAGATLFALTIIISNVLIAMRKTLSQTVIFVITSIFIFVISNVFVQKYFVLGATYSYFFSMLLLLVLYIIIYYLAFKKEMKK